MVDWLILAELILNGRGIFNIILLDLILVEIVLDGGSGSVLLCKFRGL